MKKKSVYLIFIALLIPILSFSQDKSEEQVEILLDHELKHERELATKKQLLRLLQEYDLPKWIFTNKLIIEDKTIPHSHPVLTLHTRYLDDDLGLLSTFVHEQIHWFITNERSGVIEEAIAELRLPFPEVPVGTPEGARDESSSYLHLIVCYMEHEAMKELVGEKRAREIMGSKTYYRWIYRMILDENSKIKPIIDKYAFKV